MSKAFHKDILDESSVRARAGHVPEELRQLPQWVCWRYEERGGKPTKVPYQPKGRLASSTDPETWSRFDDVVAAYENGGFDGDRKSGV